MLHGLTELRRYGSVRNSEVFRHYRLALLGFLL
jgi:hypothetical protein